MVARSFSDAAADARALGPIPFCLWLPGLLSTVDGTSYVVTDFAQQTRNDKVEHNPRLEVPGSH